MIGALAEELNLGLPVNETGALPVELQGHAVFLHPVRGIASTCLKTG